MTIQKPILLGFNVNIERSYTNTLIHIGGKNSSRHIIVVQYGGKLVSNKLCLMVNKCFTLSTAIFHPLQVVFLNTHGN